MLYALVPRNAAELGGSSGGNLAVTAPGVPGIYNRATYAKEMREALERWGAHINTIVKMIG